MHTRHLHLLCTFSLYLLFLTCHTSGQQPDSNPISKDWLIDPSPYRAELKVHDEKRQLELTNGLIRRSFLLSPNLASFELQHLPTNQSFMRAVRPEARLVINGQSYNVGGLTGQPNHAFLTEAWLSELKNDSNSLQFVGYEVGVPRERFAWKQVRYSAAAN